MLRRVTLEITDVWEECIASIIRVTKFGELETTLAVISNRRMLRRNTWYFLLSVLLSISSQRASVAGYC
jgi:hypothetical protein